MDKNRSLGKRNEKLWVWRRHINKLRGSKRDGDSRLAIFFTILRENHNEIYLFARERVHWWIWYKESSHKGHRNVSHWAGKWDQMGLTSNTGSCFQWALLHCDRNGRALLAVHYQMNYIKTFEKILLTAS